MIREVNPQSSYESPPARRKRVRTPSTIHKSYELEKRPPHSTQPISEFNLQLQGAYLNRLVSSCTPEQKENERHSTDRFIPLRKHISAEVSSFSIPQDQNQQNVRGQEMRQEKMTLDQVYRNIFMDKVTSKILSFGESTLKGDNIRNTTNEKTNSFIDPKMLEKGCLLNENSLQKKINPDFRKVCKIPFKVLDAPNLQDDFYLNLLEWSSQNILSVALDSCLYFWNANNNRVVKFCEIAPDSISSINWNQCGSQISIGNSRGAVQIWDVTKNCRITEYSGHTSRVSSVAWSDNLLASGSRDRTIIMRDVREHHNRICTKFEGHTQQVCGLKWSFDSNHLASGGNDNKLFIWSPHSRLPVGKYTSHCAAVKGIAWSPHNHGVLASGGGTADKTIKFWNTLDNTLLDSIDTGSQVCNLIFSKNTKEIVSTHGYSNNQIIIWKYPSLQKLTTLTGHTSRVLFLAMNPSAETIVTGAGDQTLRFWNVFPGKQKNQIKSNVLSSMELR